MKLIMEQWREFVNEQSSRRDCAAYEKWSGFQNKCVDRFEPLQAAPDPIECAKYENMYTGCSKEGSHQYPRQFYPLGWEDRVKSLRQAIIQSPNFWESLGFMIRSVDWEILRLHRYMMTDYGPTGSDVRQIPQMFIGRISQWTRRIVNLDPKWQYAKASEKREISNAFKKATEDIIGSIQSKMK